MDRLSERLGHHVQFAYTAWDRIVLTGYLDRLQRPENISYFFREVVGAPAVTPEVLLSRTPAYRAWVSRYAAEQAIPLLAAPTGQRKEDLVAPYYRRSRRLRRGGHPQQHRGRADLRLVHPRVTRPAAAMWAIACCAPPASGSCTTTSTYWMRCWGR